MNKTVVCDVCFRHCHIEEGERGFCGARINRNGKIEALNYGRITSIALDPIEKKPLNRFYPGSKILSVGSFGCNIRCPFCQNHEISWSLEAFRNTDDLPYLSPEELLDIALRLKDRSNIGVAFTYNEPLIGYEYVRDCAKLFHENGMKTVLVSNGTAEIEILNKILPYIDAMNIDLKGFDADYYGKTLKGDRDQVLRFIEEAAKRCHMEITTLIVRDENEDEEQMRQISSWIASLKDDDGYPIGKKIPLHVSRFFPCFHMTDRKATAVETVYRLAEIAREKLDYVYTGNC